MHRNVVLCAELLNCRKSEVRSRKKRGKTSRKEVHQKEKRKEKSEINLLTD